jgi:hypothetical protein
MLLELQRLYSVKQAERMIIKYSGKDFKEGIYMDSKVNMGKS